MDIEDEKITAWVTKYALTSGIQKLDGRISSISSEMFRYGIHGTAHGEDWHRTEPEAIARAEQMRVKKIASLEKQIAKLKKLSFTVGG